MMIAYSYLSKPISPEFGISTLVLENKTLFRNTLLALIKGEEDEYFVVSENFTPLDIKKKTVFIDNILSFNGCDKKLINKINADLETAANELFFDDITKIRAMLIGTAEKLAFEYDYDFSFDSDISTSSLIKLMDFKVRSETENPIEKIIILLKLLKKYLGIKLFITCNLGLYYDDSELKELNNTLQTTEIYLLNIENSNIPKAENSRIFIIDKDLCEVIDNN